MSTTYDDQASAALGGTKRGSGDAGDNTGDDGGRGSGHGRDSTGHSTAYAAASSAPQAQDAHRDVLIAVQRALAANWTTDRPRIAVIERGGVATVYVSTTQALGSALRLDIRGAVRAALAPYTELAPYTNTVFLQRLTP